VFSIWGVIPKKNRLAVCPKHFLNITWLFLWQFEYLGLSVVLMFLLLATLILIYIRLGIGKVAVSLRGKLAVHCPSAFTKIGSLSLL
jgi:hypothetical protein